MVLHRARSIIAHTNYLLDSKGKEICEYYGDEGGAFEKSNRRAMDLAFASVGEVNFLFRFLFVALTPGPVWFISTLPSTSSKGFV